MHLAEARARVRKTQWDLKMITGISQTRISLFENNYLTPTDNEKVRLADALGINIDDIEWPIVRRSRGEKEV